MLKGEAGHKRRKRRLNQKFDKVPSARDITYAHQAETKLARAVVRGIEGVSGRHKLLRMADGYEAEVAAGANFWSVMARRFRISLEYDRTKIDSIPKQGPVILVANHPYGILDGLMMGLLLSEIRPDFKILASHVFRGAPEVERVILPINFESSPAAIQTNINTRKAALAHLRDGALGVFPGGTVSTAAKPFRGTPYDPVWRNFPAKLIRKSGATVVPVFFHGHNSRLFQCLSHVHYSFRLALFVHEFGKRTGTNCQIEIGDPIDPAEIAAHNDSSESLMHWLRQRTYQLAPGAQGVTPYGYEFEARYQPLAQKYSA